jgi:acyl-CoA synthetase (NDP forming)/GNAT superfamily N-acetyltransferase
MTATFSSRHALTTDGRVVTIRPVSERDEAALLAFHNGLSDASTYMRFFTSGHVSGQAFVHRLLAGLGQPGQGALVAELGGRIVAVASYSALADPAVADVALAVADAEQSHGLGTLLCEHLISAARAAGVRWFTADVLASNARMLRVFSDIGLPVRTRRDHGEVRVDVKLDGGDVYLDTVAGRELLADVASLRPLLRPASVAVIGASRREGAVGHAVLRNLVKAGFPGPVYAVNPHATEILGVASYPSVSELPEVPDLAVICVPAACVAEAAEECGKAGVRALTVVSAGVTGHDQWERRLRAAAGDYGMRLVGPNCLGVAYVDPHYALDATFAPSLPPVGPIGIVTQSGGVGIALLEQLRRLGLGLSAFVSTGDKYDVSGNDMLMWWDRDPATSVAILYLESFGNPRKFSRIARNLGRSKPVLAIRSGTSDAARRAAASHTAATATPSATRDALFRQAGVIAVDTITELVATAAVLACQPLPETPRVALVTNAGGGGVLAADACSAAGLELPELAPATRQALHALLPDTASVANPADTTAAVPPDTFAACLAAVLADPGIDGLIAITVPTAVGDLYEAISAAAAGNSKPVLAVRLDQGTTVELVGGRLPAFADPGVAVAAYARAAEYAAWRRAPRGTAQTVDERAVAVARETVSRALARSPAGGWLGPAEVTELLSAAGIPLADTVVATGPEDAAAAAERLGYPVAVKAVVPGLIHKTDRGGVVLGLVTALEVRSAVQELELRFSGQLDAVTVQRMAGPGVEVLAGVVSDPTFGPLVVFGAGGVTTDLTGDRTARLAPITDLDAHDMVRGLRISPLLSGYRGAAPLDHRAAENVLLRLGALAEAIPEIAELELNPLVLHESGAVAVDARVRIVPREPADPFLRRLR